MQERRWYRTLGMQEIRDAAKKGCSKGLIQERRDEGKKRCSKGLIQERRDEGAE